MTAPESGDHEALRERVRERMKAEGIPAGTDDPLLLALGAKPLDGDHALPAGWTVCRCEGCGQSKPVRHIHYGNGRIWTACATCKPPHNNARSSDDG